MDRVYKALIEVIDDSNKETVRLFKPLPGDLVVLVENHLDTDRAFGIFCLVMDNSVTFLLFGAEKLLGYVSAYLAI